MKDRAKTIYPFWNRLTRQEQESLVHVMHRKEHAPHTLLPLAAASGQGLFFMEHGVLRVYLISPEGREVTLYRVLPGEFCILSASSILEHIRFAIYISTDERTVGINAAAAGIYPIIQSNPYVENFIYKQSAERFSDVMWAMQQILFMSFDKRLATFLLEERTRTGTDTIFMTHDQLSRQVGSAREVVSRMLSRFAQDGLVELFRGGLHILDTGKLEALL